MGQWGFVPQEELEWIQSYKAFLNDQGSACPLWVQIQSNIFSQAVLPPFHHKSLSHCIKTIKFNSQCQIAMLSGYEEKLWIRHKLLRESLLFSYTVGAACFVWRDGWCGV